MSGQKRRWGLGFIYNLIFLVSILFFIFGFYKGIKWKIYIWLPSYITQIIQKRETATNKPIHILFLFVDHYEPGVGEKGVIRNREWLIKYKNLVGGHSDSYGRKPQHTWFYAYDHKNDRVMCDLSSIVKEGYGEIEFHWHHANDTNETFQKKLNDGIIWFKKFGAIVSENNKISFGFIHGNWGLDNSLGKEKCGVTRELEILKKAGCYADFTFPAAGSEAQPRVPNLIYYAKDDDKSKSYDVGVKASVGEKNNEDLLIIQGPLGIHLLCMPSIEIDSIEKDNYASSLRVDRWIKKGICVKGRPDWIFVKVHTHGLQGETVLFSDKTKQMFLYLKEKYGKENYRLHYITAREAFNIIKAAEDMKTGDPDIYRNYFIAEPLNKRIKAEICK